MEEKDTVKIFKVIRKFASGGGDQTTTLVDRFSTLDKAENFIKRNSRHELIPIAKQRKHIYAVREDTNNILDSVHYYIEVEEIY